ncbi:hypothetical protein MaudMau93_003085 [Microsporum audouinii]
MSPQSSNQATHYPTTQRDDDGLSRSDSERRSSLSRRRSAAAAVAGYSNLSSSTDIRLRELKPSKSNSTTLFSADDGHTKTADSSAEEDSDGDMAVGRPSMQCTGESRSKVPLLKGENRGRSSSVGPASIEEGRPSLTRGRSSFRSRSPDFGAKNATRKKYLIAAFALVISLISFTVQTQTAVYIQQELGWNKPYCMLHVYILRTTAQMVESQDLHLTTRESNKSPVPYMVKTTVFVALALTIAGGSWYVAVDLTTSSDLTAIYNCSAFFAYAFSIPLLNDKLRFDKVFSVCVAIVGVIIIAYGPGGPPEGTPAGDADTLKKASNRALGNIIIGVGSVLYGLYEVLFKRFACPPEGTSSGRGVIFANTFGSMIGLFTLLCLWIPLPFFHILGWETFEIPRGETAWLLIISTLSNATFSGSFLVLISLTSPVLSSVAALLTIFLVALVDWKFNHKALGFSSIIGGILITLAFLLLSWSTYRELDEERRKRLEYEGPDSESDE